MVQPCMWFKEKPSQFSMGQTAQSLTCSTTMKKPHTGLDECPRILPSCFRARNSGKMCVCGWACVSSRGDFRSLRNSTRKRTRPPLSLRLHRAPPPIKPRLFFSRRSGSSFVLTQLFKEREQRRKRERALGDKAPLF